MRLSCLLALVLACASAASYPPDTAAPVVAVKPALPSWLTGTWQADDGALETWVAASQVLWGVGFTRQGFEVMRIDHHEGRLRFTAWPDGRQGTSFVVTSEAESDTLRFENPAHDFPQVVSYTREGDVLSAFAANDDTRLEYRWRRVQGAAAPWLEQADRDFARDTRARGADGWTSWFAPNGALWREARLEGHAAIHAAISKTFGDDEFRLAWTPTASGASPDRTLGFTVGTWTGEARTQVGRNFEPAGSGTYLTIWARQPDGTYRVLFDLGSED